MKPVPDIVRLRRSPDFYVLEGDISLEPEHYEIQIQTETVSAAKRFYKLIKDVFDIHAKIDVGRNEFLKRSRNYTISVDKHKDCVLILKAVKLLDSKGIWTCFTKHML